MCLGHSGKLDIVFLLLRGSQQCNKGLMEECKRCRGNTGERALRFTKEAKAGFTGFILKLGLEG